MKKITTLLLAIVMLFCMTTTALASGIQPEVRESSLIEVQNFLVNDEVGFALYKDNALNNIVSTPFAAVNYKSDSYTGYFYWVNSGATISEHTFTVNFAYDGSMASCLSTSTKIIMVDKNTNYRPKVTSEGKDNTSATQVYGYVTFTLYNDNDKADSEVSVKIYCNQNGSTWVNRQG